MLSLAASGGPVGRGWTLGRAAVAVSAPGRGFFCPPGEPNEVVEVFSRSGLPVTDRMI